MRGVTAFFAAPRAGFASAALAEAVFFAAAVAAFFFAAAAAVDFFAAPAPVPAPAAPAPDAVDFFPPTAFGAAAPAPAPAAFFRRIGVTSAPAPSSSGGEAAPDQLGPDVVREHVHELRGGPRGVREVPDP
ncbi:hypothetical protein ACWCP2_22345, partial [Streptomyces sp. NPDC002104]